MTPEEMEKIAQMSRDILQAELKVEQDKRDAEAKAEAERKAEVAAAVESALKMQAREFARGRRLPDNQQPERGSGAPYIARYADTRKFDGLGVADMAFMIEVLSDAKRSNRSQGGVSDSALKALAIKIAEDKSELGEESRRDMKALGNIDHHDVLNSMKANDLDYSTSAGFGDEWVGVEYSRRMWPVIRQGSQVASKVPTIEIPDGAESIVVPLESTDPSQEVVDLRLERIARGEFGPRSLHLVLDVVVDGVRHERRAVVVLLPPLAEVPELDLDLVAIDGHHAAPCVWDEFL